MLRNEALTFENRLSNKGMDDEKFNEDVPLARMHFGVFIF